MVRYENYTTDGVTYTEGERVALFREHFLLSDTMVMHTIDIRGLSGAVGAIFTTLSLYALSLILYFYMVATFINKRLELGRYIYKNRLIKLSSS